MKTFLKHKQKEKIVVENQCSCVDEDKDNVQLDQTLRMTTKEVKLFLPTQWKIE